MADKEREQNERRSRLIRHIQMRHNINEDPRGWDIARMEDEHRKSHDAQTVHELHEKGNHA